MMHYRHRRPSRFLREQSGATMLEFAIIAPLLFLLVFGIIDFGRFFFEYNNLTNAARDGARIAAVLPRGASTATSDATIKAAVVARVADQNRINASMVTVKDTTASGIKSVIVRITGFPFVPLNPVYTFRNTFPVVTAQFRHEFE